MSSCFDGATRGQRRPVPPVTVVRIEGRHCPPSPWLRSQLAGGQVVRYGGWPIAAYPERRVGVADDLAARCVANVVLFRWRDARAKASCPTCHRGPHRRTTLPAITLVAITVGWRASRPLRGLANRCLSRTPGRRSGRLGRAMRGQCRPVSMARRAGKGVLSHLSPWSASKDDIARLHP